MSRYDPLASSSYAPSVRAASPWRSSTPRPSRPSTPSMRSIPLPESQASPESSVNRLGGMARTVSPLTCPLTSFSARVAPERTSSRPSTPFRAVTPFRTVTPAPSRSTTPSWPALLQPDPLLAPGGGLARLQWDMRTTMTLSAPDLARPATNPDMASLRIRIGPWYIPFNISPGEAYITVRAVVVALYGFLANEIGPQDWDVLQGEMRRNAREKWRALGTSRKLDALGCDTIFAGLRPSGANADVLVLQTAGGLL